MAALATSLTAQLLSAHNSLNSQTNSNMSTPSVVSDASSGLPPPAKRAKVLKTPAFSEVTLDSVILGGKSSHAPLLADGVRARFDLTPPGQLVFSNLGV